MSSRRKLKTSIHRLVTLSSLVLCAVLTLQSGSTVKAETMAAQEESTPTPTPAASPTPTPDAALEELDKRIKELEKKATIALKEKEIAENEAAQATAEKSKITNLLPTATATPLAGTTTVTGTVAFQGELLAYKSLADIADGVGSDLHGLKGTVVIHNDGDINALQSYAVMLAQIKMMVSQYNELLKNLPGGGTGQGGEEVGAAAILAAPQVASTLLRSVADIAALFRTNTEITGLTIAPDEAVLNAQIAVALRRYSNDTLMVFEPKLYLPNLFVKNPNSEIVNQLGRLSQAKTLAEQSAAEYDSAVAAHNADEKKNPEPSANQKKIVPKLKALNAQVDTFLNSMARVDENTKQSPLASLYRAEKLKNLLEVPDEAHKSYVLHLKLAKAEGTRTTKTNLFTGTKMSHTGGMILAYTLFDSNGQIMRSGVIASYRGSANNKPQEDVLLKLP